MARETNQVAELVAVAAALRVLPVDAALHIRSDSQYAINSATAWVPKWKANGWRSSTGQPVMNLGWVQEIDRALTDRRAPTTWEWVKGHAGDQMNEAADARCGAARTAFQTGRPVPKGPGWTGR